VLGFVHVITRLPENQSKEFQNFWVVFDVRIFFRMVDADIRIRVSPSMGRAG